MIQSPQSPPKRPGILIILAASLLLNSVGIWYGLPSWLGWAPDEILPRNVQDGIAHRFSNDWFQKYPPLQYYLLALVETPLVVYAKLKGLDFDDISLNSWLILAHRLLSLIMAVGIVFLVYKCGREVFNERSALFSAMIAALLVPFVYYAKTANLDVPYLFWFMSSLLFFLRLRKTRQRRYYLLFALSSTLAICTKDQAYGLYILPPLVILFSDWKFRKRIDPNLTLIRFLNDKTYILAAGVAVGAFFLIYNLAFNAQGFLDHIKLITGPVSQSYRLVSHTLSGHIYLLGRTWSQVRFSLGWPLFLVCLAGVIRSLVSKPRNALLLSLFAFVVPYEVFYIHVVLFNYCRYYLPLLLILSLFGGQFLAFVLEARPKFSTLFRAATAALFIYSIFYALSLDILMIKDTRYAAEKWIRQNIPQDAVIGLAVQRINAPRVERYQSIMVRRIPLRRFQALSPKPDFIIINTKSSWGPFKKAAERSLQKFYMGKDAYGVVFRQWNSLPWLPLRHSEVLEQINSINPEIVIYKKLRRP